MTSKKLHILCRYKVFTSVVTTLRQWDSFATTITTTVLQFHISVSYAKDKDGFPAFRGVTCAMFPEVCGIRQCDSILLGLMSARMPFPLPRRPPMTAGEISMAP